MQNEPQKCNGVLSRKFNPGDNIQQGKVTRFPPKREVFQVSRKEWKKPQTEKLEGKGLYVNVSSSASRPKHGEKGPELIKSKKATTLLLHALHAAESGKAVISLRGYRRRARVWDVPQIPSPVPEVRDEETDKIPGITTLTVHWGQRV
ncbi:hypothetical protein GWK47_014860 [Chionoecetes opilio]|uniref:Uncharacterized protein n=1 Tax=Chionoecetes opilio TaxID=41210 RepID=A0A8J4XSV8_CHIOP|nr:hypothetical protein GWK47_014860 [Chionoecetes opilio]